MRNKKNAGVTVVEFLIIMALTVLLITFTALGIKSNKARGISNFDHPEIGKVYNVMAVDLTSGIIVVKPFTSDPNDSQKRFVFKHVHDKVRKQGVWFIVDNGGDYLLVDPPPTIETSASKDKPVGHEVFQ